MTNLKLDEANFLKKRIKELEDLIKNTNTQKCEWIVFTFGNGSNRASVCTNPNTIELVRELITKENTKELESLKKEFANL